jgi:Na+/H+ antiporter NhaD/arsenite permease-like protein
MMVPIVHDLFEGLGDTVTAERKAKLRKLYVLAVTYSANMGGGGGISIGSNANLIYRELISA